MRRTSLLTLASATTLACLSAPPGPDTTHEPAPAPAEEPVAPPTSRFVDLFVSDDHGCALGREGKVWCWGAYPGAVSDDAVPWTQATMLEGLDEVIAIDGDAYTTCAIKTDGAVWCGTGSIPTPQQAMIVPEGETAVDVEVASVVCVRYEGGGVGCEMPGQDQALHRVANDIVDFAVTAGRACGLDAKGGVWCWDEFAQRILESGKWSGTIEQGPDDELLMARLPGAVELGVGDSNQDLAVRFESGEVRLEPIVNQSLGIPVTEFLDIPGARHAIALAFGEGHGCIVAQPRPDAREVRCFGGNGWAQLGAGDSSPHPRAVTVDLLGSAIEGPSPSPSLSAAKDVVEVATSRSLSCALTDVGVSCWGTRVPRDDAAPNEGPHLSAREVESVVVGYGNTCASLSSGDNVCWGRTGKSDFERDPLGILGAASPSPMKLELGRLRMGQGYGYLDEAGLLLWAAPTKATWGTPRTLLMRREGVEDIAFPAYPCMIIDGRLACEDYGGNAHAVPKLRQPTAIAASGRVLCTIHHPRASKGRGQIGCFTAGSPNALFGGGPEPTPELIDVPGPDDPVDIIGMRSLGRIHSFVARDASGSGWMFLVELDQGVLEAGDGGPLPLPPASEFVFGDMRICGLQSSGEVSCVRIDDERTVESLPLEDVVDIAASEGHLCALSKDKTLSCLGDNRWGQLGAVPRTVMASPVAIRFD